MTCNRCNNGRTGSSLCPNGCPRSPLELATKVRFDAMARDKHDDQRRVEPGVDHFCFQYINLGPRGRQIQIEHMRKALLVLLEADVGGGDREQRAFRAVLRRITGAAK